MSESYSTVPAQRAVPRAQLSRDILKWLQGLDLAYSIKNVRRDFSNGFLVAEILSRYFPNSVQMHSFDSGSNVDRRKDNWKQLLTIFKKVGFQVYNERETVEGVMNCKPDIVIVFITQLFTFLTARKVSRKVASKVLTGISNRHRKKGVSSELPAIDQGTNSPKNGKFENQSVTEASLLDNGFMQSRNLGMESGLKTPSKVLRGENRQVGLGQSDVQVKTGSVKIKALDSDIMKLRAEKQGVLDSIAHSSLLDESKSSIGEGKDADFADWDNGRVSLNHRTPMQLLEGAISETLGSKTGFSAEKFLRTMVVVKANTDAVITSQEATKVFKLLQRNSEQLGISALGSPLEWGQIVPAIVNTLIEWELSISGQLLAEVGQYMSERDSTASSSVFFDFIFPSLKSRFTTLVHEERIVPITIFLSHCPMERATFVQCYDRLGKELRDFPSLSSCAATMCILMHGQLGDRFSHIVCSKLVQIGLIGISHSSPSTRAASVLILSSVIEQLLNQKEDFGGESKSESKYSEGKSGGNVDYEPFILSTLAKVAKLTSDSWWEVQSQLVLLSVQILSLDLSRFSQLLTTQLKEIVTETLRNRIPLSTKLLGAASLSKLLSDFPELMQPFVCCFVGCSRRDQVFAPMENEAEPFRLNVKHNSLNLNNVRRLPKAQFPFRSLTEWFLSPSNKSTVQLTAGHIELLEICCDGLSGSGDEQDMALVEELYNRVAGQLFRCMETNIQRNDSQTVISCFILLCEKFTTQCRINVFTHPLWLEILPQMVQTSRKGLAESFAKLITNLEKVADENVVASIKLLLQDSVEKAPKLSSNPSFTPLFSLFRVRPSSRS